MISTAVVTVGTSLFQALDTLGKAPSGAIWLASAGMERTRGGLTEFANVVEELRRRFNRQEWERAGEALAQLPADLPQWGAEVATLRALRNEPECRKLERVQLLISDTADGQAAGEILAPALTA